jgi:hypothetical protein
VVVVGILAAAKAAKAEAVAAAAEEYLQLTVRGPVDIEVC